MTCSAIVMFDSAWLSYLILTKEPYLYLDCHFIYVGGKPCDDINFLSYLPLSPDLYFTSSHVVVRN